MVLNIKALKPVAFFFYFIASAVLAQPQQTTLVSYRSPESDGDKRYEYNSMVLRRALEKTIAQYGPFQMVPAPRMNVTRTFHTLSHGAVPTLATESNTQVTSNFVAKLSYEKRFSDEMNMVFARFPVDLGIVGYRVCFVSPEKKADLLKVSTLSDLKKFTHGQGRGWSDVKILQANDINVTEVEGYELLFKMVAANRFDLFCRGTNELRNEYFSHQHIKNLTYDKNISIAYPLPRFFYSHKKNAKLIERIEQGLILAYEDGSLLKLWLRQYGDSLAFANLKNRTIYKIKNPFVSDLKFDYEKYFYDPLKSK